MINVGKHVAYWRESAEEDWASVAVLMEKGRFRHALFFMHLAIEKALKAHVCARTGDIPPRIHNLVRLSELTPFPDCPEGYLDFLAEANVYNIEGRYPDTSTPPPSTEEARVLSECAGEVFRWLMNRSPQK
ncbi:MAG TPA: HEPN domain-containing protein [Candidatus Deferrimicrobiaceae bacterium]|jgi:HEPN domain-containing protein